jgi:alpha-L-rhamnosidase
VNGADSGSALRWWAVRAPQFPHRFCAGVCRRETDPSARLYATALGLYEFEINGQRVGDYELAPGWTDYNKRVQYQAYDVTECLRQGDNAIGAILGDGWYSGHVEWRGRQRYGDRPKLLAQLVVFYEDGSNATIVTDGTWKTTFGPIVEADLIMGESYDARLELGSWSSPAYDDARWLPVDTFRFPDIDISPMLGPAVKRIEELKPVGEPKVIYKWPPTITSSTWGRTWLVVCASR